MCVVCQLKYDGGWEEHMLENEYFSDTKGQVRRLYMQQCPQHLAADIVPRIANIP